MKEKKYIDKKQNYLSTWYIYIYPFLLSGNIGLILRHGELPFHPHLFIFNTNNND